MGASTVAMPAGRMSEGKTVHLLGESSYNAADTRMHVCRITIFYRSISTFPRIRAEQLALWQGVCGVSIGFMDPQ